MSAHAMDVLMRLAPRERLLLAVLGLLVLPAALWFGTLDPLRLRAQDARTALEDARAMHDWVQSKANDMEALGNPQTAGPKQAIGLPALEQSLISSGLREVVSGLANAEDGGIEISFDAVDFIALMSWLSAQDPGWGYDIVRFRIVRGEEPGRVSAELRLLPQT